MKRLICFVLSLVLVLSLFSGCGPDPGRESTPSTAPAVSETTPPPETTEAPETVDPMIEELRQNLPVMDGSTSLIPLEAGIRAAIFDISVEEATKDVHHTTTWEAFYNLLNGSVDLVFSVPLSKDQMESADVNGVIPIAVPIAKEGFVFVVNAENPVDTLTQQQIRDIYSGRITNWSEVGGLDEEIIPYQRNYDSGSQNYMLEFMGDTPLTDAPSELRPASMSGLMDVIAVNDNSRAAIGYSVYAYAANMYGNGNEIKFIKVDGVAPSKATFADGTYPLMGYNYAIYRAEDRADSYVSRLVDWILSDAGQWAIAEAGYISIADTGYNYTEDTMEKYEGIGLGAPAAAPASSEYVVQTTTRHEDDWGEHINITNELTLTETVTEDGLPTWHITHLADKALEAEINRWIDEQMVWVSHGKEDLRQLVENLNRNYEYDTYVIPEPPMYSQTQPAVVVSVKNGYLSVAATLRYEKVGMAYLNKYHRTETAVWDLFTGERLAPEELFCRGVDIDQVLNTYIQEYTQTLRQEFEGTPDMIRDFVALPESGWHLAVDGLYIDHTNPDFAHGEYIPLDWLPDGVMVTEQPRDFSSCIAGEGTRVIRRYRVSDRDLRYIHSDDGSILITLLDEQVHPNAAKINAQVTDYLNTRFAEAPIMEFFNGYGIPWEEINLWYRDWYLENLGGTYLFFYGSAPEALGPDGKWITYPQPSQLIYDLRTGEQIHWTELLQGDWFSGSQLYSVTSADITLDPASYEDMNLLWVRYQTYENALLVCLKDEADSWFLTIPGDFFRFE